MDFPQTVNGRTYYKENIESCYKDLVYESEGRKKPQIGKIADSAFSSTGTIHLPATFNSNVRSIFPTTLLASHV